MLNFYVPFLLPKCCWRSAGGWWQEFYLPPPPSLRPPPSLKRPPSFYSPHPLEGYFQGLGGRVFSGPLNRLNAIVSLLHPLDRSRTPSAIGSAIGRPLSRPISHPNTGGSPQRVGGGGVLNLAPCASYSASVKRGRERIGAGRLCARSPAPKKGRNEDSLFIGTIEKNLCSKWPPFSPGPFCTLLEVAQHS